MINLLLAASLSTAIPAVTRDYVEPRPAMFMVRDADTTIYLFGTFHTLDANADWFNGNMRSAFEGSQELVLETITPGDGAKPGPVAGPRPFDNYSVAPANASFLSNAHVAITAGRTRGMSVSNGADVVLRRIAEFEGKSVEGLETFDSQLRMFGRLPPSAPQANAVPTVSNGSSPVPVLTNTMSDMQSAWKRGDHTFFVRLLDQMRRNSPDTYRMMFTERNARWADWIAARLRTPGTVFIAVGAGHLAGKDSVLVRLAEHGIESSRLN